MTTPEFPEDDDPAAYKRIRCQLEGECFVELWTIAKQGRAGEARMSSEEKALVTMAFGRVLGVRPYPMWRAKAEAPREGAPRGCQHEPETLEAIAQLQAIDAAMAEWDAIWAELKAAWLGPPMPCKIRHTWAVVDNAGRCPECGEPLAENDPKN